MPDGIVKDDGPNRREGDHMTWSEVEVRLRVLLAEFRAEMLADIYERNLDPLKDRVDLQDRLCALHAQELTTVHTLLDEVVEAKLIRRVEVAEARLSLIGKATTVIGGATVASLITFLTMLFTHQIHV